MPKKFKELTIIRDTREQEGWIFDAEDKKPGYHKIIGTEETKLDTGDYSIKGLEDVFTIERKAHATELFMNYTPKSHKERFEREMERMSEIKHKYIIVESTLNKDILSLSIPQMHRTVPYKAVVAWLFELQIKYGFHIIWAGDAGKRVARMIIEKVARECLY